MNQMEFIADKVIAQEVALSMLINAVQQLYPEVGERLITGLDHVLKVSTLPTKGSRANLVALRAAIAQNQPTSPTGH